MNAAQSNVNSAPKGSRLWLWIVAAFVFQGVVWAVWITLARKHPVQEVPLVHRH